MSPFDIERETYCVVTHILVFVLLLRFDIKTVNLNIVGLIGRDVILFFYVLDWSHRIFQRFSNNAAPAALDFNRAYRPRAMVGKFQSAFALFAKPSSS